MNTLVFLHGWGTDGNIWRHQAEAFSGQGFKMLTPTFPVWEVPWLIGYLHGLPLTETILVGWSLGGMLLLEALSTGPFEPAGLVLIVTPASFCQRPDYPWGQPPSVIRALRRTVRSDSRRGLGDFAGRCLAPGEKNFQEELLLDFQPREEGADLASGLDYLLHTDLRPRLSRVPAGPLIIQGEQDAIVPPAQADFLGQHLKEARMIKFPEAGHIPFFTRADEFNAVLNDFLRQNRDLGSLPLPPERHHPQTTNYMNQKQAIQRNFGRRGASYERYARVQPWMAEELLRGCRRALFRARAILEVGCGTGYLTQLLRQDNPAAALVALDLDLSLLKIARERLAGDAGVHFVAADGEAFFGGSYDLIISNSVFQWFSRPRETLQEYYRLLRPGGCLAFSTLGPATFRELDTALRQAAGNLPLLESPGVVALTFSGEKRWQHFLGQAGFQEVTVQREEYTETHPTVQDFLRALQGTGATNPAPRPLSPRVFRHMAAIYQRAFGVNGSIPVTYEVIWAWAQKRDFFSD